MRRNTLGHRQLQNRKAKVARGLLGLCCSAFLTLSYFPVSANEIDENEALSEFGIGSSAKKGNKNLDNLDPLSLKTFPLPEIGSPEGSLSLEYKASVGGFHIGTIEIDVAWDRLNYVMDSRVKTDGLADWIAQARYHNSAHGVIYPERVAPILYSTHYQTRSDQQYVKMSFDKTMPISVMANPAYSNRHKVTDGDKYKSVDPMSGILYLIMGSSADDKEPCGRRLPIYDGKRRYDFKIKHSRNATLKSKDPEGYNGPGLKCKIKYVEVAGFRKRDRKEDDYPWVNLELGQLDEGRLLVPVRITAKTDYGGLVAKATKVKYSKGGSPFLIKQASNY